MTTEDTALRITQHIRAGLPFTANQPEVERGIYFENRILDSIRAEDLRTLLQLYISHAYSTDIREEVQRLFSNIIYLVAQDASCLPNKL